METACVLPLSLNIPGGLGGLAPQFYILVWGAGFPALPYILQ